MSSAIIIAQIFGPFLAIVGLWMLLFSDNHAKVMTAIKNSAAAQYGLSVGHLLWGLIIISLFNVWEGSMLLLVTLLGWALFVRGVLGLYMPHFIAKYFFMNQSYTRFSGILPLVWGLLLIWIGFYYMM